ncbi:putative family 17 glucosidase SCW4 [Leucoagaricus sp. SymC.cos]|nr:putative family 17 glucosidase SCW4 [Leucoagaricus sp. SymC.cos]
MKFAGSLVALLASLSGTLATTNFAGLTASNSIGGSGAYTCRTQAQWNDLANAAGNSGFKSIRILGFDCNALLMASSAAASAGLTVLAGIYFDGPVAANNGAIDDQVNQFRSAVGQFGAGRYVGLTIGNEVSSNSFITLNRTLRGAGINTPVSTVHNWVAIRDNPVLCQGDFVGANAHAFYDPNTPADQTGNFVMRTAVSMLRNACGSGKQIIITESGWPSRGGSNGAAVASLADEHSALLNLNCACRDDRSVSVYAFENSTFVNASGENAQPQNGEFEVLHWLTDHIIKGAELDSSERDPPPRCHPGTHTSILERTRQWFEDPQREKTLLWIRGPAGVGKSAIVQTFAESVPETQQLGACLFFSRPNGYTNPQRVFPTLAYRFAIQNESYRSYLTEVMRKDPHSLGKAMCEQFRILVAEPLARHKLGDHLGEFLVAIDGLDECDGDPATENSAQCLYGCRKSEQVHREIVQLISDFVRKNPTAPLVWIVASRPETHIQAVFSEANVKSSCMEEDIPVDSDEACRDVEKFLHASFVEIYYQFPDMIIELPWPGDRDFLQIARAAGGLFVFAQVVVRFIEDPRVGNTISQL